MACNCPGVTAFLREIGAPRAAMQHESGVEESPAETLLHFDEEETHLCPRLRDHGLGWMAAIIERDHAEMRPVLLRGEQVRPGWFAAHARFEETAVAELWRRMARAG